MENLPQIKKDSPAVVTPDQESGIKKPEEREPTEIANEISQTERGLVALLTAKDSDKLVLYYNFLKIFK